MAGSAGDMDDTAAFLNTTMLEEAPHPHVVRIVAGEYAEGGDYATWRHQGTSDWLLIHTVGGSGRVAGTTGEILTAPGDAVLLRPRLRHDYGTAADHWSL